MISPRVAQSIKENIKPDTAPKPDDSGKTSSTKGSSKPKPDGITDSSE